MNCEGAERNFITPLKGEKDKSYSIPGTGSSSSFKRGPFSQERAQGKNEGTPKTEATEWLTQAVSSGAGRSGYRVLAAKDESLFSSPVDGVRKTEDSHSEEDFRLLREMLRLREDRIQDLEKEVD